SSLFGVSQYERPSPLHDDPSLEVRSDRPREDDSLYVTSYANELVGTERVRDALDVLLDDRTFVEVFGRVVSCGSDELDSPRVRLVIGFGALKGRQEAVMNVDDRR